MKKVFGSIWFLLFLFIATQVNATLSSTTTRAQYSCNGVVTTYAYSFTIYEDDDLLVTFGTQSATPSTMVLNTDYTVTNAGVVGGGNVELTSGDECADGYYLTITRQVEETQEVDFVDGEAFSADTLETAPDKLSMIAQQQQEQLDRSIRVPQSSIITSLDVPVSGGRVIGWNSGGTGLTTYSTTTVSSASVDVLSNYDDLADACSSLGAGDALWIDQSETLGAGVAITCNANIYYHEGIISGTSPGSTLTFGGGLAYHQSQQLYGANLTVNYGANISTAHPESWGVDGTADQTEINLALAALSSTLRGIVKLNQSTYTVTGSVDLPLDAEGLLLRGVVGAEDNSRGAVGGGGTVINWAGATAVGEIVIDMRDTRNCGLENLHINGADKAGIGIYYDRTGAASVNNLLYGGRRLTVRDCTAAGIRFGGTNATGEMHFFDTYIIDNLKGIYVTTNALEINFFGLYIRNAGGTTTADYGIYLEGPAAQINVYGLDANTGFAQDYLIYSDGNGSISLFGGYSESVGLIEVANPGSPATVKPIFISGFNHVPASGGSYGIDYARASLPITVISSRIGNGINEAATSGGVHLISSDLADGNWTVAASAGRSKYSMQWGSLQANNRFGFQFGSEGSVWSNAADEVVVGSSLLYDVDNDLFKSMSGSHASLLRQHDKNITYYVATPASSGTSYAADYSGFTKVFSWPGVVTAYADNAAAVAGGLVAGDIYRIGDTLAIVH